jgi:diguanylate cyclase (GGDEF)-like protein
MTLPSSLRAKLTLALVAMSFVAIAVVGLTSRWVMLRRFDDLVVERAMEGFVGEIAEYYEAYGSFEAAREAEPFSEFVRRARPGFFRQGGSEGRPGPRGGSRPGDRDPPPERERPRSDRYFEFGGAPPPLAVADRNGTVILSLGGRQLGDRLDLASLARGRPILSNGAEIGVAVPLQRPALTEMEERYLAAMQESWVYALLLAAALAIPVGVVLGTRFTAPIRELTGAIQAMRGGALRQSVQVRSNDEVGLLSGAFNEMSDDLATVYQQLESSRTRLQEQAAALAELSRRDALTDLLNRRAFDEQAELIFKQARRYDHPLTLAMVDVDHFKRVNDEHSHAVGDAVLREVARIIQAHVRDIDIVARYGGEEFAVAFPETTVADARQLSDRLRALVADHDWGAIADGLSVTLSVGLGERTGAPSFREILALADSKLYEAKTGGRNRVCA